MPYTPTTWTDDATPLSSSNLNNLETQYNEAVTDLTDGSTPYQVVPVAGLTGATAASRYVGATPGGAPTSGTFAVGDFVVDQTGLVWICTGAGNPGAWTSVNKSGSQIFTANGTFVVPTGVSRVFVQCWGGGGGGAGAWYQGTSYGNQPGGSGGGGAYADGWVYVSSGQNIAVTVGSGGSGGAGNGGNPGNSGVSGGDSAFGNYTYSTGGGGGGASGIPSPGGGGGIASSGIYLVDGGNGGNGGDSAGGGNGATSFGGSGGAPGNGNAGNIPGGGGGGGTSSGTSYSNSGGNGARGEVRVYY